MVRVRPLDTDTADCLEALAVILPITADIYLTYNRDCALGVKSVQGGLLQGEVLYNTISDQLWTV